MNLPPVFSFDEERQLKGRSARVSEKSFSSNADIAYKCLKALLGDFFTLRLLALLSLTCPNGCCWLTQR